MVQFKDEARVRRDLERNLRDGEVIQSIGKAVRWMLGTKYYTALTNERMIIANCVEGAFFRYKSIPLSGIDDCLRKKGIVLLPFDAPFLISKREWAKFKKLQEMMSEHLVSGEELISIARAKEGSFPFPFYRCYRCLGFTNQRILVLALSSFGLEEEGFNAIPLSEMKAIRYALMKKFVFEIPFEDSPIKITLVFREGNKRTFWLMGINGIRKYRFQ